MLSTASITSAGSKFTPPPGLLAHKCLHKDHFHDCYTSGHQHSEIYTRRSFTSPIALITPQMGAMDLESFPSAQFTLGDQPAGQQTQWTADLGEIPKDCYYCRSNGGTITGKCSNDSPNWGSGKDYMGNECANCSGTGVCPRCGGDGVMNN